MPLPASGKDQWPIAKSRFFPALIAPLSGVLPVFQAHVPGLSSTPQTGTV